MYTLRSDGLGSREKQPDERSVLYCKVRAGQNHDELGILTVFLTIYGDAIITLPHGPSGLDLLDNDSQRNLYYKA